MQKKIVYIYFEMEEKARKDKVKQGQSKGDIASPLIDKKRRYISKL